MKNTTCCFIGHRTINETEELKNKLIMAIEKLITEKRVDTFLFGSKSKFNSLCLELVTGLKEKYSHIKRVYVRAEFPVVNEDYKAYLLKFYEDTYYPKKLIGASRAVYIERNCEMIDKSGFCIIYCDEENCPTSRKSGTKTALDYAVKRGREIITFKALNN